MIRILLIGPLPPPMGGDTRHFAQLAEDLASHQGFAVRLVNTSRGAQHSSGWHNLWTGLRTLAAVLRNLHRSDVISFHASDRGMVMFGPPIVALGKLARRPVILRLFGGSFGDYWASRGPRMRAWLRRVLLSADAILFQTQRMIAQMRGQGAGELVWFSTYIKQSPRPADLPAPAVACTRFVFLGHLWRTKGVDTLLEAAAQLPDGISVDLYGPRDEYTDELLRERGQGRVVYRGFLSHAEVERKLWEYDCLVLPTFHPGEGYPGVIAEAFAHGLPVISTRWLAIPEMVDESCGLLVEPGDTAALVAAMRALHADPGAWRDKQRGALRRAAQFDHAVWARKFEQLCERLVRS